MGIAASRSEDAEVLGGGQLFNSSHIGNRLGELWPKLGDGSVRKAAYRGGWKPA